MVGTSNLGSWKSHWEYVIILLQKLASGSIFSTWKCIWFLFWMLYGSGTWGTCIHEVALLRMLHTFSQAAAEHSRTYGDLSAVSSGLSIRNITAGYGPSGQSLSLLEDVDSGDEDEAGRLSCCQRVGIYIGYVIPDWGHLSLANVGRSWAAGAIALWHCLLPAPHWLLWTLLQPCYDATSSGSLKPNFMWSLSIVEFKYHVTLGFFGAFFRCYILLSVTSDLLRFTYLLCKDTWRPDSFEGYRRLLVGDAWKEIEAGEFYSNNWSMCLTRRQKLMDAGSWFQYTLW